MDIGCIECGECTTVIGLYASREAAEAACDKAYEKNQLDWRGQHSFEVFDLNDVESFSDITEVPA